MFAVIVGSLLTLILAYLMYILFPVNDNNHADTSIDAFIIESQDDETPKTAKKSEDNHYRRSYDTPGRQLLLLYGTEYGFSEEIAKKLFDRIDASTVTDDDNYPWQPRIVNVKQYESIDLSREHLVFVVISTAGDGIPPTDARPFYNWVLDSTEYLSHISYSVLALGDSNYPHFCRTGKIIDKKLSDLRCHQLVPCHIVDMEDWEVINRWCEQVLDCLDTVQVEPCLDYLELTSQDETGPSRTRPFMANMIVKRPLTHAVGLDNTDKETIHCELHLSGSEITWTSGDALGIYPENNPSEVESLMKALGVTGQEMVDLPKWAYHPKTDDRVDIRTALMKYYDLKTVRPEVLTLLQKAAKGSSCQHELNNLLIDGISKKNTFLHEYLYEREVVDVLEDFTEASGDLSAADILAQMKGLQPRYYSIASSPVITQDSCCVTAAIVHYKTLGRQRTGVTTTYLQDRLAVGQSCPVFISHNPEFRLPSDGDAPIIMIGPGTGIAPFMAFISERIHTRASGRNRFYFGCRHKDGDFLYKQELESWAAEGMIELRTAFSRDQPNKIYVQHLLKEDSDMLWELISQQNAYICICGDAKHMAKDVHKQFVEILVSNGNMTATDAETFMINLENTGHYQKDVWVT